MIKVFYVEKRDEFNVESKHLLEDFKINLMLDGLVNIRVLNKYIIKGENLEGIESIIHEPPVDTLYYENFPINSEEIPFGVEYLPGQFDQRAQSTEECFSILKVGAKIDVNCAKIIILNGNLNQEEIEKIKKYYINLVDSREVNPYSKELNTTFNKPNKIEILKNFTTMINEEIKEFHNKHKLAMSLEDLKLIMEYFKKEEREPSITEIKVIDTYWSDHCRHTTFNTSIEDIEIKEGKFNNPAKEALNLYNKSRKYLYENTYRDITLMDLAVISMKEMRKRGLLDDLDVSDEINACSINVKIETDKGMEDYVLMFKNETHNHPTEIEPFGGAATCLGGAIRDPLSGRTYVYQAMRVTGSADPTVSIENTLEGKLPQRKITLGAAKGYSSYGNQIGLATGEVREVYHPNYVAKRMEIGAVLGVAPKENIFRSKPIDGDVVILLGGRTGRDGLGGATGSSKEHTVESIDECGAEVQKGNSPTERKIQRLFRNKKASTLIKKCNDFGAGGVSVAIGELSDSLDINLDLIPKKYEGLDGTEIAISESQERMAVVVDKENAEKFISLSEEENLEATVVAHITNTGYMRMFWNGEVIVNLKREFLDTNGAKQFANVLVKLPNEEDNYFNGRNYKNSIKEEVISTLKDLNVTSQKGLIERFDSTIGGNTVLMPLGGKYQLTPSEGMACKIPVLNGYSNHASLMTNGFNPYLSSWSPYHGAYYSIIEAVTKIVSMGGSLENIRLTLQEYFEKLHDDEKRWGKPFTALLGAFKAQMDLGIPAIGGKDSMSGSFGEIDVPPSLVAFAVNVEKAENIISSEFKKYDSKIVYLKTQRDENEIIYINEYKRNMKKLHSLIKEGKILSAMSIKNGGICEAVSKMSFGNMIGFKLNKSLEENEFFEANYGSVIIEISKEMEIEKDLEGFNFKVIGQTQEEKVLELFNEKICLQELIENWQSKLNTVFKSKTEDSKEEVIENIFKGSCNIKSSISIAKPKVVIPVFPGTNCEYDSERAFVNAGAKVNTLVFRNLNKSMLEESLKALENQIRTSQILMLPGGFSAGDEPDGSGKFIATVFRNERIKDAVMDLLNNRDGLILGICNGFQALIKLGLVTHGEIIDIKDNMPTLTYNKIGRHMSSIINTKVVSKLSPWFNEVEIGDIHKVPISHGEGRFMASTEEVEKLFMNGQVATQYVDFNGNPSLDMPYNPNGSIMAIEGITSPNGRVLGKMGHSERIGDHLYKNIGGNYDQKIFISGVNYFK